ncbi:S-adenosyl-L-methionine-dependent methyltransferase [Fomitopsis serialis]|uniref:S-adenosyl-L-methionine-dependent methyltransferase n=1 Tax=Fomitopsis serialis TaxID=139415 RepID=UPI00200776EA|nr:S-adenosyl-L-methionine-dependent methyltransferase [Neoantrodia serialis]KAH9938260.1 S-adenosyl-L-methionine-dependent methyltransferase [Neoantrodia serialis]
MSASEKAQQLRSLIGLLTDASEIVIKEWEAEEQRDGNTGGNALPSQELYDARRVIRGACGMCADMVGDPLNRLEELSHGALSLMEALYILVAARIPDILAEMAPGEGMPIYELSRRTEIDDMKLARVLRLLCTSHVLSEVKSDHFANTRTSLVLVRNEPAQSLLLMNGFGVYMKSMDKLPSVLMDPVKSRATAPNQSAFQEAVGTDLTFWEWCEQGVEQPDGTVQPRPLHKTFSMAMMATGQIVSSSISSDYPWAALGSATVVDVGGGVGSMAMELAAQFPQLRFVVADRGPVIEQGQALWMSKMPSAIQDGRVSLQAQDFFQEQPIKGAEVYFLRYILHDWPDDVCVTILKRLRDAMSANSRILVADMVMHTTVGSPLLKSAPTPLPANYGCASVFKNMQDLAMLALFNGTERTPEQLSALAARAGLRVVKIWECRSILSITEMRLP